MSSCWEVVDVNGMFSPSNRSLHAGAQTGVSFILELKDEGRTNLRRKQVNHFISSEVTMVIHA